MKLIDADELFKSFESEENPEDSLWTLYGIKRKIEDAPRQEPCEDATLRDIFCMGCEYKEQEPKTGHWIPVSEKLPEENGRYLVTIGGLYNYLYIETASYAKDLHKVDEYDFESGIGDGWYDYDGEYGHYEIDTVVAWMPLPEPYKAESEEI